mmetsp:Transcript_34865/g.74325  ORF Transcript_34865/g.74325 Transcript_34865/m.74325 type:complete len:200 (-) Transcript_34865:2712-3311(-)
MGAPCAAAQLDLLVGRVGQRGVAEGLHVHVGKHPILLRFVYDVPIGCREGGYCRVLALPPIRTQLRDDPGVPHCENQVPPRPRVPHEHCVSIREQTAPVPRLLQPQCMGVQLHPLPQEVGGHHVEPPTLAEAAQVAARGAWAGGSVEPNALCEEAELLPLTFVVTDVIDEGGFGRGQWRWFLGVIGTAGRRFADFKRNF